MTHTPRLVPAESATAVAMGVRLSVRAETSRPIDSRSQSYSEATDIASRVDSELNAKWKVPVLVAASLIYTANPASGRAVSLQKLTLSQAMDSAQKADDVRFQSGLIACLLGPEIPLKRS